MTKPRDNRPAALPTFEELLDLGHTAESAREQMAENEARHAAGAKFRAFAGAMEAAIDGVRGY